MPVVLLSQPPTTVTLALQLLTDYASGKQHMCAFCIQQ
jgi:hypothetical protein